MIKQPTRHHQFALARDFFGNAAVIIKTGQHFDYIYGMFKGREARGGHLEGIESWHLEGEKVALTGHPTKGDIVLVMGIPITEITGDEAKKIIDEQAAKSIEESPKG